MQGIALGWEGCRLLQKLPEEGEVFMNNKKAARAMLTYMSWSVSHVLTDATCQDKMTGRSINMWRVLERFKFCQMRIIPPGFLQVLVGNHLNPNNELCIAILNFELY